MQLSISPFLEDSISFSYFFSLSSISLLSFSALSRNCFSFCNWALFKKRQNYSFRAHTAPRYNGRWNVQLVQINPKPHSWIKASIFPILFFVPLSAYLSFSLASLSSRAWAFICCTSMVSGLRRLMYSSWLPIHNAKIRLFILSLEA